MAYNSGPTLVHIAWQVLVRCEAAGGCTNAVHASVSASALPITAGLYHPGARAPPGFDGRHTLASMQKLSFSRSSFAGAPKPLMAAAAPRPIVAAKAAPLTIEATQKAKKKGQKSKLKTRKAVAKRFKVTASGKVFCRHAGRQHLNEKKEQQRLKRLSKEQPVFAGDVRSPGTRALPCFATACWVDWRATLFEDRSRRARRHAASGVPQAQREAVCVQVRKNIRLPMPYAKISLKNCRKANSEHD